ncbi:hypothetical protein EB796_017162 [Bugula neritina]|uniref:Uncharacterized protein n=1 Tax=Bugula neritina TaxID=10212 RepID=A0A7J7JE11_BUGNE|nr:hypothetical protein EB796_017162 [Bugula neritina]
MSAHLFMLKVELPPSHLLTLFSGQRAEGEVVVLTLGLLIPHSLHILHPTEVTFIKTACLTRALASTCQHKPFLLRSFDAAFP